MKIECNYALKNNQSKILVVEDDELQAGFMVEVLKREGFEARSVATGEEALQYLTCDTADLLLLDMELGCGMDGLETFLRVRIFQPRQKAIMISGYGDERFHAEMKECGLSDFVSKPFTIPKLLEAIKSATETGEAL